MNAGNYTVATDVIRVQNAIMARAMEYSLRWLQRQYTADSFGETYGGPEQELERLEHGRTLDWDGHRWQFPCCGCGCCE
jgi:hypothetical protein